MRDRNFYSLSLLLSLLGLLASALLARGSVFDWVPVGAILPEASDLQSFPLRWEAEEQAERLRWHRQWIGCMRAGRGYDGGRWEQALAETEFWLDYWETLVAANQCWFETVQRHLLQRLRAQIGPQRYQARWSPPLLPDLREPAPTPAGNHP